MARVWFDLWELLWVAPDAVLAATDQADHVLAGSLAVEGVIEGLVTGGDRGCAIDLSPGGCPDFCV